MVEQEWIKSMDDQELFQRFRACRTPKDSKFDWAREREIGRVRLLLLKEVKRRGRRLLKANGWPDNDSAEYVNIHTGTIRTLYQVVMPWAHRAGPGDDPDPDLFVLLEHWLPVRLVADPNQYKPVGQQLSLC